MFNASLALARTEHLPIPRRYRGGLYPPQMPPDRRRSTRRGAAGSIKSCRS